MARRQKYNKYKDSSIYEAVFDFHNLGILNQNDIHNLTKEFIETALQKKYKKVLIITGKGVHSKDGIPKIKPIVKEYLATFNCIYTFSDAPIDKGGAGALQVVLST